MRELKKIYYQLKGISIFVWLPIIGLYILLPISHYLAYKRDNLMEDVYCSIIDNTQFIIPLLSIWYVIFVLYHLVEQKGHEILYLDNKIKWKEMVLLYLLFLVMMVPLFLGYTYLFSDMWLLFLKLAVINLVYTSFAYACTYVSKSIIPTTVIALLYSSLGMFSEVKVFEKLIYSNTDISLAAEYWYQLFGFIVAAIIFSMIGYFANRRFTK